MTFFFVKGCRTQFANNLRIFFRDDLFKSLAIACLKGFSFRKMQVNGWIVLEGLIGHNARSWLLLKRTLGEFDWSQFPVKF
jgi:hypothetical protein